MWLIILTTILVIGSCFAFIPPQDKINQGLDVQGGLSVVLSASSTDGSDFSDEDMEKSRSVIESRVNALGASEAVVQIQGNDQILVQIPGMTDAETALNTIGKTGVLEFARADSFTNETDKSNIENNTYANKQTFTDDFGNSFEGTKTTYAEVKGSYTPLITGENIKSVSVDRASETGTDYAVNIKLDAEGTKAFAEATKELAATKGQIVIILDHQIQSAPAVQSAITGGEVSITGNYTLEEAQALQTVLESGSLPVSFHYEQSQVVGPTLGQNALAAGVLVALIGLLLVILYLLVFYHGLGLLTAVAMAVFAILYMGLLGVLSSLGLFSLSLAGVAGIVLTMGMAADSSILVLERFREEIRMGRSVRAASITGVRHGIQTSIDADLVTLVSALTLFFLASASVKGFGMTLALGIVCDIVMMLILKGPLVRLLAPHCITKHPGFWGVKDCEGAAPVFAELNELQNTPNPAPSFVNEVTEHFKAIRGRFIKKDINFMGVRKFMLAFSACLIVLSFAVVGVKGLQFGIEFVGGTSITFNSTGDITTDQMRAAFDEAGEPDAVIQTTQSNGENGFLIRTATTSAEDAASHAQSVAKALDLSTNSYEVSTIGPDWGSSVINSSLIAFAVSLLLIICYIAIRFEYKMGVMAVVALLHDLIIVVGIYALVGREITPNTVAALLTILGYSLYDTVVVFHRINENVKEAKVKATFLSMANHSINQVFLRTINTTTTSLVPVLAMCLFGGETLQDFAFAMVIGLVSGSYSSICVATPLFCAWKSREASFAKLRQKLGSAVELFTFASTPVATLALADGATTSSSATVTPEAKTEAAAESASAEPDESSSASEESPKKYKPKNGVNVGERPRYRRKK
ncbi:MAG: protein translocase subunit SecD [Coriobacteriia bacterium]|nr:protein translocase subunit SecD [Coriobacteriia bacterium]